MDCGTLLAFFYRQRDSDQGPIRPQQGEDSGSDEINAIFDWYCGLSGTEAVCWGFDTVPSKLGLVYWQNTDEDISTKVNLKLGIERAKSTENLQSLSLVVSSALGGKKKPKGQAPRTGAEAEAMFNRVFGINRPVEQKPSDDPFKGLDGVFEKLDTVKAV